MKKRHILIGAVATTILVTHWNDVRGIYTAVAKGKEMEEKVREKVDPVRPAGQTLKAVEDGRTQVVLTKELVFQKVIPHLEVSGIDVKFQAEATFQDRKGAVTTKSDVPVLGWFFDAANQEANKYKDRSYHVIAPGVAHLGLEKEKLKMSDIKVVGNEVYIQMPKPHLSGIDLPYHKFHIDPKKDVLAEDFTEKDRQNYYGIIYDDAIMQITEGKSKYPENLKDDTGFCLRYTEKSKKAFQELGEKNRKYVEENLNSIANGMDYLHVENPPVYHVVKSLDDIPNVQASHT